MNKRIDIFDGEGMRGRSKKIWVELSLCDLCENEEPCIGFDSSDDEYSSIYICKECFNEQYKRVIEAYKT